MRQRIADEEAETKFRLQQREKQLQEECSDLLSFVGLMICNKVLPDPVFSHKHVESPGHSTSAEAAEVLLPAAERAVTALRKVQDGFYLARQFGRDEIDVVNSGAATGKLNLEDAPSEYLEMLRNATHGFGSNNSRRVGLTNTLLAHHDGDVPHDIGFLGYLYLLDLMSQPEVLRGALYRGGRL